MLKSVPHRLQLLPNGYIDDAYNSNPAGFRAALDVLSRFEGQRVLVTPGMVELGQRQAELNRELGAYAAPRCDYVVLVGEKQAPPLLEGLTAAGFAAQRIFVAKTLQEGLNWVTACPSTVCGRCCWKTICPIIFNGIELLRDENQGRRPLWRPQRGA